MSRYWLRKATLTDRQTDISPPLLFVLPEGKIAIQKVHQGYKVLQGTERMKLPNGEFLTSLGLKGGSPKCDG